MNDLWHHWFAGSWTHVIALSLAHFLWQGVLVGLVVASLDKLLSKASTSSRYVLHLVALASLPVCFVLTMGIVDVPAPMQAVAVANEVFSGEPESALEQINGPPAEPSASVFERSGSSTVQTTTAAEPQESQVAVDSPSTVAGNNIVVENPDVARNEHAWLPSLAPIIVIAYLLGVAVFLIRLTLAVWGGHRLRSTSQPLDDSHLLNIVAEQARRVGLRIVPVVALCERVAVPTVVGVVRPMVLIPASIITGLAPDQFATIISHELAHIRRYDLLVTLLQRTIESFFFFHPVVWYLSRRISRHREVCCDDLVVSTGHGPMDYAGALLRMAELCVAADPTGAIAATATGTDRSQFESRVKRLMTMTQRTQLRLTRVGAVLLGSLLIPLMTVPPLIVGVVQADQTEDTDTVTGTLQVQMAVLTPGPKSDENVYSGSWQVAVDWKVPIRTEGGAGSVISEIDGAILRIEWQAVRRHNGGLQFDGFNWSIDNPIDRRDGVSLGGIGGRQIAPQLSWFGDKFESLASMQLDTAGEQKSDRVLIFRAKFLSGGTTLKRLSVPELLSREADEFESESSLRPDKEGSDETEQLFQTAYDSDPSFGRASIKHADQRGTIANWNRALQQDDLTRAQQIFAWWRIGSLAAYNFNAGQGEAADNDLAAEAFRKVLSIGNDLVCRETLGAATVYATLGGGTREDQASRTKFANQWLATRTDAMVVQSAWLVNHNGYAIDGRLMPGGMNLQTEAEKAEYLTNELANARESVAARAAMAVAEEGRPMLPDTAVKRLADRLVAAAGSPTWKLHHVDKQPAVLADDSLGYRITLRRTWEEYSSLPQQRETPPDELGPFELKHEDWEFVLFPREGQDASRRSDASTPAASGSRLTQSSLAVLGLKILWETASSPYHTQAVCMGEGHGFLWYSLGTLFGQETIREKLKLTGGDDRIDLLIAGTQVEDEGNITANSCARLMERFGDEALGRIETAIEQTQEPTALRGLTGSLASIRTNAATKLLMRLHESDNKDTSAAADYALVHRPLRPAAKSAYLDMLLKHRHVDVACEGCVHFRWKEALPILVKLTSYPESLRELSWTIPARRKLEGMPIEYKLIGAKQTIIADRTDPNDVRDAWQTLTDSEDFEAVVLIGIELATYTTKGPQKRINDFGFRVLLTQPRDELAAYLKGIGKVMSAENAKQVQRLLRQLQQSEQLQRLQSHGILVTPGGIGGASHRYVVPGDFLGGYAIDDLLQYCVSFSPKSEIVFFGPVITDDQFRQFQLLLPESHVRRMAAVWLNIVATVSDDERERGILRVSGLGSPAREIGLQVDDVIVGIGPFRWPKSESRDAYNAAMLTQRPGQESKIVVDRDGKVLTFPVTWEESTAHRLLCGNGMPTAQREAIQSGKPDVDETPTIDNIQALAGKWEATEASHHLLDSKLVEANQTGFAIAIDKQFGESYRKTSDTYKNQYREFLEQKGHAAVVSGTIKFDCGGESELMISRKDGGLCLWYGVVTGGNPRIFLHGGADKTSIDSLAIQWTSACSDSPLDLEGDSALVFYRRSPPAANQAGKPRRLK
ncbi:M56 family metallopeptidase [Rhodopirellula sp. JC639]|uniref:M56 family metallopeptidase n=1 Tax=Stieleria mannarensis TaxID=2755585 RepID=UPI0016007149|nr:M56 family metallopeptidase [Rhodopirellula sp. JC639]